MLPKTKEDLQRTVNNQLEKIVGLEGSKSNLLTQLLKSEGREEKLIVKGKGLERDIKDHMYAGQKLAEALSDRRKTIEELKQRVLDEQSAFDKMEELFLQGQEGFRVLESTLAQKDVMLEEQKRLMRISNKKIVELKAKLTEAGKVYDWQNQKIEKEEKGHKLYKRLYEKNAKFLRTTLERLKGSSWKNEQELRKTLNRYGRHTPDCRIRVALLKGNGPVCDCGWEDEQAVLALLDQFSEQDD